MTSNGDQVPGVPALTIRQPYAHHIVFGRKRVENRTWQTSYRGTLGIHAGKSKEMLADPADAQNMAFGVMLGTAELIDCVSFREPTPAQERDYHWIWSHPWAFGPWCWVLTNIRAIRPANVKGRQGLWRWTNHPPLSELWDQAT